ncbi:hypothetical protein ZWY2020_052444 [Hordeum vulgare]|nr:hypothetical protein ZWY2020_052444 [Hordeum vulgare]
MSFLAGRLAAQEGAYFLQESRNAASRLAQAPGVRTWAQASTPPPSPDVLPEILRHSMPLRPTPPPPDPTLYGSTRWALPPGGAEAASSHLSLMQLERLLSIAGTVLVIGEATAELLCTANKLQLHSEKPSRHHASSLLLFSSYVQSPARSNKVVTGSGGALRLPSATSTRLRRTIERCGARHGAADIQRSDAAARVGVAAELVFACAHEGWRGGARSGRSGL